MYIKYIVLMCITYCYTPMVNSYDQEVEDLFNKIRYKDNNYITYGDLFSYCDGDDSDEIVSMIQEYGINVNGDSGAIELKINNSKSNICEYRMNFKAFVKAANEGRIPKFPKADYIRTDGLGAKTKDDNILEKMTYPFLNFFIDSPNICSEKRQYLIFLNPITFIYKVENVFMAILSGENRDYITIDDMVQYYGELYIPKLEKILSDFGKKHNEEYRLTFPNFRRAVNIGVLPKPD